MSKSRAQKQTLLLVGEGYDEEAFLKYLKSQLVGREAGLEVKIKNAKGKGAKHVIDWTIRQVKQAEYDVVAALLDTDTDWTPAVQKQARTMKIIVLTSEPCFEAKIVDAEQPSSVFVRNMTMNYLNPSITIPLLRIDQLNKVPNLLTLTESHE